MLRYICQNPVKAGLCSSPVDYPRLGCSGITGRMPYLDSIQHLTDLSDLELMAFISNECDQEHQEDTGAKRLTDQEAIRRICESCGCSNVQEIEVMDVPLRASAVRAAIEAGVSIRQLSRLTAISKAVIERICRG